MLDQLSQSFDSEISFLAFMLNTGVGIILSLVLRWHFSRFGSPLSNRAELAQVFPFVLLTTLLIITIVKSSLALSLGLVGALSIVRFRTPIKEPEELAYLFLAIAFGLGLGANQTLVTIVAGLIILLFMGILKYTRQTFTNKNLYISFDWQKKAQDSSSSLNLVTEILGRHVSKSDLRRFDVREEGVEATFFVDLPSPQTITQLVQELEAHLPDIGITFIDQNQMPSV